MVSLLQNEYNVWRWVDTYLYNCCKDYLDDLLYKILSEVKNDVWGQRKHTCCRFSLIKIIL